MGTVMIIDTLAVVCLMADTPRIQPIKQAPANRFTEQFREADSLFNAASDEAMKSAFRKTRLERYRALGIISPEEYRVLKRAEKELDEMKALRYKVGGKP